MSLETGSSLLPVAPGLAIDQTALLTYLRSHVSNFPVHVKRLHVYQFSHGQSNPTYCVKAGPATYVVRKKPPGAVLPSAHAVEREYRVLRALKDSPVPVAPALALCEDSAVLGTAFYVMAHVSGRVWVDPAMPGASASERKAAYGAMGETLAALHSVDVAAAGLGSFGRPDAYNSRQVRRWSAQYAADLAGPGAALPDMEALRRWLQNRAPEVDARSDGRPCLVHGDFRLDNLVLDPSDPTRVRAVLDWELSTLGDSWSDVAYCCLAYHLPEQAALEALPQGLLPEGVPTEAEFLDAYCRARGVPRPEPETWAFYLALSLFRAAAILAGVGARARQGNASSRRARAVGADDVVRALAARALDIVRRADPAGAGAAGERKKAEAAREGKTAGAAGSAPDLAAAAAASSGLEPSLRAAPVVEAVRAFVREHVLPAEAELEKRATSPDPETRWTPHPELERLKTLAQERGLWNLWVSADLARSLRSLLSSLSLSPEEQRRLIGPELSNVDYAHCAQAMGWSLCASEAFNCSAPDTGNMEILARHGSPEQQRRWLLPLLRGEIRSCFAMTEPDVGSSDATQIQASMRLAQDGRAWTVRGRKWWASGAKDPRCRLVLVMGKSDPGAAPHRQQSILLLPAETPGLRIGRALPVFGFDDAPHGHAEIDFEDARVASADALLGNRGAGFAVAQARLGPGRLHHCMRLVGGAERGLELLVARAHGRVAFGGPLKTHQAVRLDIARSRVELEGARLLVLEAARQLDRSASGAATRAAIAAAKVAAPQAALRVLDRAIQMHGAGGVSDGTPLAHLWAAARTLRIADGPDVVHLETIARMELKKEEARAKL